MQLTAVDAHWIIDNYGPPEALPVEVAQLASEIESRLILADAMARHFQSANQSPPPPERKENILHGFCTDFLCSPEEFTLKGVNSQ